MPWVQPTHWPASLPGLGTRGRLPWTVECSVPGCAQGTRTLYGWQPFCHRCAWESERKARGVDEMGVPVVRSDTDG